MSDKINVEEILKKYGFSFYDYQGETLQKAFKEALEAVIDKCAENSQLTIVDMDEKGSAMEETRWKSNKYFGTEGYNEDIILVTVDKESILNVKKMINYD